MNAIPIHVAVTVIVEDDERFLMTNEMRAGAPLWYFPSGALEPGESLAAAASREVLEETGYTVHPLSIIRIDHGTFGSHPELFWWRYVISARLLDLAPLTVLEADIVALEWVPIDRMATLPLRSADAGQLALRARALEGLNVACCVLAPDGRLAGFYA